MDKIIKELEKTVIRFTNYEMDDGMYVTFNNVGEYDDVSLLQLDGQLNFDSVEDFKKFSEIVIKHLEDFQNDYE